jgi:hypothetical protein
VLEQLLYDKTSMVHVNAPACPIPGKVIHHVRARGVGGGMPLTFIAGNLEGNNGPYGQNLAEKKRRYSRRDLPVGSDHPIRQMRLFSV